MPVILSCPLQRKANGIYQMGEYTVHYGTESLFVTGDEDPIPAYVAQTVPDLQTYRWDDWGCGVIDYPEAFFHWNRHLHQLSKDGRPRFLYWVGPT